MRAAVDPRRKRAVVVARDDDGRIADEGAFEIARIRNFGFERNEVPGRTAIDPLLLALVHRLRAEDLVGHARAVVARELHHVAVQRVLEGHRRFDHFHAIFSALW